jgi:peptide/nickel transport system permease protein
MAVEILRLPMGGAMPRGRVGGVGRFLGHNLGITLGLCVLLLWVLVALTVPLWAPYDPLQQDVPSRFAPPSLEHPFGTDSLGRDVLTRVLYGVRLSLPTAVVVIASAVAIGCALGILSGFVGGVLDEVVMRLVDSTLAFPSIVLAMAVASALKPSLTNAMVAMVAVWWPEYARLMRGQVLALRDLDHVQAARLLGANSFRILRLHIAPLTLTPIAVKATLDIGNVILLAAGLSFLGLGAPPPNPEWGAMVSEARANFNEWWLGTFPALAIVSIVLSANFIGDGLRDYLDPRTRRS